MKIFKIEEDKIYRKALKESVSALKNNALIVYPTDTLYGLGANALNPEAIKKVFDAKGREFDKPISILVRNLKQAKKYFLFNQTAENFVRNFLPGPLTIILKSNNLPKELSPTGNFSFRIIKNKVTDKILKKVKFPITATSANVAGGPDPTEAQIAINQLENKADVVLDAGKCKISKPSTVIDLTEGFKIVREGAILKEELLRHL